MKYRAQTIVRFEIENDGGYVDKLWGFLREQKIEPLDIPSPRPPTGALIGWVSIRPTDGAFVQSFDFDIADAPKIVRWLKRMGIEQEMRDASALKPGER